MDDREAFSKLSDLSLSSIKFFIGHYPYGVHKVFPQDDFKYITVLRDPVERIISWYKFLKSNKSNSLHEKLYDKNFSDGIRIILDPKHGIVNQMSFYLSGEEGRLLDKDKVVEFALKSYDHIGFVDNIDKTYNYLLKNDCISPGSVERKNASNLSVDNISISDFNFIAENIKRDLYIYEKLYEACGKNEV